MKRVHPCVIGLAVLALAGCGGTELEKAERPRPGGSAFDKALYEATTVRPLAAKTRAAPVPGKSAPGKSTRRFVVYFPFASATIGDNSSRIILRAIDFAKQIVAKQIGATRIHVTGHTDRAGSGAYNNRLSDIRANAVVTRLTGGGISPRLISLSPAGERMPAVETRDGARQAENRRVEIDISN